MIRAAKTALSLVVCALAAGCGGNGDEDRSPTRLIDQTTNHNFPVSGPSLSTGHTDLIIGPTAQLPSYSGFTSYCYEATLRQLVSQDTNLVLSVAPASPKQGPWVDSAGAAAAGAETTLIKRACTETRPVNTLQQQMQVYVRGDAQCPCLDDYVISVRWTATFYPD